MALWEVKKKVALKPEGGRESRKAGGGSRKATVFSCKQKALPVCQQRSLSFFLETSKNRGIEGGEM